MDTKLIHPRDEFTALPIIRWILALSASLVLILGTVVVYGWITHDERILQIYEGYPAMQLNTALYFVVSGLIIFLFLFGFRFLAVCLSVVLLVHSSLTLMQYVLSLNFNIDLQWNYGALSSALKYPGRPAPNTLACFILLGLVFLLTISLRRRYYSFIAEILACVVIAIASGALFGYILELYSIISWYNQIGMAFHTTLGIVVLGLGLLLSHTLYLFSVGKYFYGPFICLSFVSLYVISFIWKGSIASQEQAIYALAQNNASYIQNSLKHNIDNLVKTLRQIVSRWEVLGLHHQFLWEIDVKNYENDLPELSEFRLYDKDLKLKSVYKKPLHSLDKSRISNTFIEKTNFKDKKSVYFNQQGDYLLILIPLFVEGNFEGVLFVNVDVHKLIGLSVPEYFKGYYVIKIFNGSDLIFQDGDGSIIELKNAVSVDVNFANVHWVVKVIPKQWALMKSYSLRLMLVSGLILTSIMGMIFYLLQKLSKVNREVENALANLNAIVDSSSSMIISTDPKGTILLFNKAAESMLQWTKEEMINKVTPRIIHDEKEIENCAKKLSKRLDKPIKPGHETFTTLSMENLPDMHEWTYIRKDKSRFPVQLSLSPVKNKEGELIGYVGNAIDITRLKEVERMKNDFIAITSHELRSPLTAIHGALDLIKGSPHLDADEKTLIQIACKGSERLIRLTTDILDIQKMQSGKMTFHCEKISPKDILTLSLASNSPLAIEKEIQLKVEEPIPECFICVDSDRIQQVLGNFISNAVKNSPKGGTIVLRAEKKGLNVRFEVIDQGSGIPEAYRPFIFQKFMQVPKSDTTQQGSGLGLTISKAIIEEQRGVIGFVTSTNTPTGSTFWFEIPCQTCAL